MVRTVCLKNFDFASHTDRGKVRPRNEDFLAYFDTINGHVFVVCDGMGGHNAGEVASELAVESIGEYFNQDYYTNPFEAVEKAIVYANEMVYRHAVGNDYLNGMGTTIVLVLIRDDRVYFAHAGDSRLYLYKNNILDQMTVDHSHVQELLDRGVITPSEAKRHPQKNEITRALGLSSEFEPEVSPKAIIPTDDDILLLCSDGLTNVLENEEIISVLNNSQNLNDKAAKLISKANKKGGPDNISIQIIKFHNLIAADEEDDDNESPLFEYLRNLLKQKKITYLIAFLFVLGTSFFIGIYESPKVINYKNNSSQNDGSTSSIVIAYLLKPEENLSYLSEKFNTEIETLKNLNPNFDSIKPGMHFKIPVRYLHVVQQVDELPLIVARYQSYEIDILKANDLVSRNLIVGSELIIPLNSKK
jgi:serine/threonine protein phosphatase PrpC